MPQIADNKRLQTTTNVYCLEGFSLGLTPPPPLVTLNNLQQFNAFQSLIFIDKFIYIKTLTNY